MTPCYLTIFHIIFPQILLKNIMLCFRCLSSNLYQHILSVFLHFTAYKPSSKDHYAYVYHKGAKAMHGKLDCTYDVMWKLVRAEKVGGMTGYWWK